MPKYYIPLIMVIEAPDYEAAQRRADSLEDALINLAPMDLEGFADIDNLDPCKAADQWYDDEVYVITDGKHFYLSTETN